MGLSGSQSDMQESGIKVNHEVAPRNVNVRPSHQVNSLDRWFAHKILEVIGQPEFSFQLWDGTEISSSGDSYSLKLVITDRGALWRLLFDVEYHFGELYASRRIMIQGDLVEFLEKAYRGIRGVGKNWLSELLLLISHRPHLNSLGGSHKNIHHHYNIGNPFYELWLDKETMQYTCAYFPKPDMTLEQAQAAKLHHVARKLQLSPGQTVVEAGSGWGGLARFFARHYGVKVKAYNISREQVAYAKRKAKEQGLDDLVEYVEDDYRNITGTYDVFVSVGMLEHVGRQQYIILGSVVDRCLRDDGVGLIHSIGRNKPGMMNSWVEKRIFPGAYPPSIREMMDIFEPHSLCVQDLENIRLHYARTIEHWLARFNQNEDKIRQMFDANFIRAWRLYLAGSIAAFTIGELQLFQILFTHEQHNNLPWSRTHLYTPDMHPPGGSV